jgi:peptidoglycan/LPS O-acetylase OafA/YrhL
VAKTKPEIKSLTGLRGLAALLVVVAHFYVWCSPYPVDTAPDWLRETFDWSALGMTIFFALSGFVMAYHYLDLEWREAPLSSLRHFMLLRFSRLYPALLLFLLIAAVLNRPFNLEWSLAHLLSIETWLPLKFNGVLPVNGTFFVAWSISTEIGLYLMFVAGAIVWHRNRLAFLILAAIVGTGLLALSTSPSAFNLVRSLPQPMEAFTEADWHRWFFYCSPYWQIVHFSIGVAGALIYRSNAGAVMAPLFRTLGKPLEWKPLLFVGEISYSLYLFHFLAGRRLIKASAFSWTEFPFLLLNIAAGLVAAIIIAYFLYRLVEIPARQWLRIAFADKKYALHTRRARRVSID